MSANSPLSGALPPSGDLRLDCLILGSEANARKSMGALAASCGLRVAADCEMSESFPQLTGTSLFGFLLIDIRSEAEVPSRVLSEVARYADRHNSMILLWSGGDVIDDIFGMLPFERTQYLIGASDADAILAMTLAKRPALYRLTESADDDEEPALRRISDELTQMAGMLARIAGGGKAGVSKLKSPPTDYRGPPGASGESLDGPVEKTSAMSAAEIREIIRLRRLRAAFFNGELFSDPAWDMLLDLMAARIERQPVSVSSLCIAADVPATTALRWIKHMTEAGLLERHADTEDARRIFVGLSDDAADRLARLLAEVKRSASRPL